MTVLGEAIDTETVAEDRSTACAAKTHVAEGFNFYKLFWILIMGSVLGYIIETLSCLIKHGHYENRSNLVFGPINLIYGMGALVLYLGLRRVNQKNHALVLIYGMAAGTVIEFCCSFVQEMAFGTVSWDYSRFPLNIDGRVCLLYSVYWGAIALLWVSFLLPLFEKAIRIIPNSVIRPLTWCLLIILLADIIISVAAVARWITRIQGDSPAGVVGMLLDRFYPDARMKSLFASMKFIN